MSVVSGSALRKAVETSLQAHLPGVLAALGAEWDVDLPAPKEASWKRLTDFRRLRGEDSPAVVVTSAGIDSAPQPQEGGGWRVSWLVRIYVVVAGRSYEETADRVADYAAAVRVAALADPTLGGLAVDVVWRGESHAELDRDKDRTVAAGSVSLVYTVPTDLGGPAPVLVQSTAALIDVYPPSHPAL